MADNPTTVNRTNAGERPDADTDEHHDEDEDEDEDEMDAIITM